VPHDLTESLAPVVGASRLDDALLRDVAAGAATVEVAGDTTLDAAGRRELLQAVVVAALREAWDRTGEVAA
jgi:hypothetical protein